MKLQISIISVSVFCFSALFALPLWAGNPPTPFDPTRDLFLAQFDSKTDVDDLHSVAGVATMLRHPELEGVNFHAVAGAYGIQEGLFVPAPELFQLAFGNQWSNAHQNHDRAVAEVAGRVENTLLTGGHVWVAEAGQSDFSSDWLKRINDMHPALNTRKSVHVVQHSDWNESVTSPDKLAYVRQHADYQRIADGNTVGNGTPGFNTPSGELWEVALLSENAGELWKLAQEIANQYNGVENRYKNESIAAGGLDFSDVSETCWIFGFGDLLDANAFFNQFSTSP